MLQRLWDARAAAAAAAHGGAKQLRSPDVQMQPALLRRRPGLLQADTEKSALETAIDNARETCEGGATGECANAWDDVEELSAEMGHKREGAKENKKDVLEE